jgi:alpha-glucosidase
MFFRTHGQNPGRDGCRVPMPWSGQAPPFGFSPSDAAGEPWLPQPPSWADRTVEAQSGDPDSMLELYRRSLACRRQQPTLGDGELRWLPAPASVLAFSRQDGEFACVVNLSDHAVDLPVAGTLVLSSDPLVAGQLPPDTTAWLVTG